MKKNINFYMPEDISLIGIKLEFICNVCHKTWALYLMNEKTMPKNGLVCRKCEARRSGSSEVTVNKFDKELVDL